MSIANRILSVLVLLASIGAIVLAFMLFNAREEVVSGREIMAQAIADNSNKLAQTSTENPAKVKITPEEMSVAQGNDSVGAAIKKFDDVTKAIITQRNLLADQLVELATIVSEGENGELTGADLANVKTNEEKFAAIKKDAEETVELYKKTRDAYVKTVKDFEKALEMQGLDSNALDPKNPDFAKIKSALDSMDQKIRAMYSHISIDVNGIMPDEYKVKEGSMSGENYEAYLKDQKSNMEAFKTRFEQLVKQVEELTEKVNALTAKVEELAEEVKKLEAERDKLKADFEAERDAKEKLQAESNQLKEEFKKVKDELDKLKKMGVSVASASSSSNAAAAVQLPVQTAALAAVEGKVVYVDSESGLVVLNIGLNTTVDVKNAAGKKQKTQLVMPQNAIMTVATSMNPDDAKFVCKIQVYKVEANQSMANILSGGSLPKVGDVVFFSATDIVNSTPVDAKK